MNPESVCIIASGERYDRLKRTGVFVNGKRYAIVGNYSAKSFVSLPSRKGRGDFNAESELVLNSYKKRTSKFRIGSH
jgi:hypothetical protein